MRKILALIFVLILCGTAFSMQYPELGVCIGNNVRLRESPGTKGKIIGRADSGTRFIILDEVSSGGQKWYKIDHPEKKGNAYILAKYAQGWYNGGNTPIGPVLAEIRLKFGITPEKARALLGKPAEVTREDEAISLKYPGCELHYDEGYLQYVLITKKGFSVSGIQVSDDAKKLLKLGMPEDHLIDFDAEDYKNWDFEEDGPIGYEGWLYESKSGESIFFEFEYEVDNEKMTIGLIVWNSPVGEG